MKMLFVCLRCHIIVGTRRKMTPGGVISTSGRCHPTHTHSFLLFWPEWIVFSECGSIFASLWQSVTDHLGTTIGTTSSKNVTLNAPLHFISNWRQSRKDWGHCWIGLSRLQCSEREILWNWHSLNSLLERKSILAALSLDSPKCYTFRPLGSFGQLAHYAQLVPLVQVTK